jgi:hypothetical protein
MNLMKKADFSTWETLLVGNSSKFSTLRKSRRIILQLLDKKSHKRLQADPLALQILRLASYFSGAERLWARFLLTRLLPFDPLKDAPQPLEIFIFTSRKDLEILPLAIVGASESHVGEITAITIVHPQSIQQEVCAILDSLSDLAVPCLQKSDEVLLGQYHLSSSSFAKGNIKMEVVKIIAALESSEESSLLIDGDTVLLKKRNWVTSSNYLLMVAQEYSNSHISYNLRILDQFQKTGLGFVTHHQLIKKKNVSHLVSQFDGISGLAQSFEKSAEAFYLEGAPEFPSEWQLIGDFQLKQDSRAVHLVNFSNLGISRSKLHSLFGQPLHIEDLQKKLNYLRNTAKGLGSVSFHQYKS